jgi:hypothetical protein
MQFWVKQTVAAINELGRLLVVARESRQLYDYLNRVLSPDELVRVILDRRVGGDQPVTIDRRRGPQADTLLKSYGIAVVHGDG